MACGQRCKQGRLKMETGIMIALAVLAGGGGLFFMSAALDTPEDDTARKFAATGAILLLGAIAFIVGAWV